VVGRKLRFRVRCRDEQELIGEGSHERTVIRAASFIGKAEGKRSKDASGAAIPERLGPSGLSALA